MNDITYVGKHTVIYTVSRHAHDSYTAPMGQAHFFSMIAAWITGKGILSSSRP